MSPECSKHQVLSFAKMLVVNEQKKFVLISVLQNAQWINSMNKFKRDGGLSTLCHSFGFACQQRVLKTFPGLGYFCFEDGVVWLCNSLINLYMAHHFILLQLNPCDLSLGLIGRDGGLSTLCQSCRFACQQWVLKTFPGPGCYLRSEDGVVWLCHSLVNLYIYQYISL